MEERVPVHGIPFAQPTIERVRVGKDLGIEQLTETRRFYRILNLWTVLRPSTMLFAGRLAPPSAQTLPEVPPRSCPQPYSPPSPQPSRRDFKLFAPQTSLAGSGPCRTHRALGGRVASRAANGHQEKEIVINTDPLHAEEIFDDRRQFALPRASPVPDTCTLASIRRARRWQRRSVELTVRCERQ